MSNESGSQLARQARQLIRSKRYREAFQYAARARDQDPRCAQVIFLISSHTPTRPIPDLEHGVP